MLSRASASQSLRRSLFASTSTLIASNQPPKYVRLNSSTVDQPTSSRRTGLLYKRDSTLGTFVPPIVGYKLVKQKTEQPSPDSYLIDVREPDEVIQGSIPSSVNIPLSVLPASLHMNAEDFEKKFGFKKPKKNQEIIFYCRSGVRAATAGDIAKKNGFEKLYNFKGSWLEWVKLEGHKVGTP